MSARISIFTLVEFLAEYRTERELLNGLIDGSVDAIFLFDCGTREMKRQSPPLTIVGALELYLRVRVGFAVEEGNEKLEECLQSLTNEEFSTELMNADCDFNDDEDEDWQVCEQLKYAKQFYISIAEICSNGLAYLSK